MKKADFMLGFLFWTLLGIIIIVPASLWASQFFKLSDKAASSYNQLGLLLQDIRDGELLSMPLYMDDKTAIIGISKISKRFEAKSQQGSATSLTYYEVTDPKCQGKTCICLCKEIGYETKTTLEWKITCKETSCEDFNDIEFLKIRPISDFEVPTDKLSKISSWWENGFIILTDSKVDSFSGDRTLLASVNFGGAINIIKKKTKTVYIQRYRNYVNVCYNQTCINEDTKNKILSAEVAKDIKDFT